VLHNRTPAGAAAPAVAPVEDKKKALTLFLNTFKELFGRRKTISNFNLQLPPQPHNKRPRPHCTPIGNPRKTKVL